MAVELTAVAVQTVPAGQNVLFSDTAVNCRNGYVVHRDGAGIVTLRGIAAGNCCFARYRVSFFGNIAVPEGGTVGPISVGISVNGETIPATIATVTPTAAEAFFNVGTSTILDVPRGCCYTIAVENATTPAAPIDVSNANLLIERIA